MLAALALTALFALAILVGWIGIVAGWGSPRRVPAGSSLTATAPLEGRTQADTAATREPPAPGTVDAREFKRRLIAREWRAVLPSLLVIVGLLGVMTFGAIAMMFALESPTAGILMLLVALGAAAKLAWDLARA